MKKQLLIGGLLLGSFFTVNAQLLESDNFNALAVGNIGTDMTGATPGTGGFYTQATAGGINAGPANFQIVNDLGTHANVAQITGSNAATGTKFLWKDGLGTAWPTRAVGNNVIEFEISFNTGAVSTSTSLFRPVILKEDFSTLGGFSFNYGTKVLSGFAFGDFNNTGTPGNYNITLKTGGLILPANTWIRIGFAYDTVTGDFVWACNDVLPAIYGGLEGTPGYVPGEFDVLLAAAALNNVAPVLKFDDYTIKAKPVEDLLSTGKTADIAELSIFPNPVKDIITIANANNFNITGATVTDMNGRIVKQNMKVLNNQINVADLSSGVYLLSINSDAGSVTKKIVKQ